MRLVKMALLSILSNAFLLVTGIILSTSLLACKPRRPADIAKVESANVADTPWVMWPTKDYISAISDLGATRENMNRNNMINSKTSQG